MPPPVPEALPGEPPTNPTGLPGLPVLGGAPAMPDSRARQGRDETVPDQPWPRARRRTGPRDVPSTDDAADDHYVPPAPPPLPRLDPVTKGAWLALVASLPPGVQTSTSPSISGDSA